MKHTIKLIVTVVALGLMIVGGYTIYQKYFQPDIHVLAIPSAKANDDNPTLISKKMVVKTLKQKAYMIGLEGENTKHITYSDTDNPMKVQKDDWRIIQSAKKWINKGKERNFDIRETYTYQMGFDLASIQLNDITIDNTTETVFIKTPKIHLFSFIMPYDKLKISVSENILAREFTEKERQMIYHYASETTKKEILKDETIHKKAEMQTEEAIRNFLMLLPEVKKVEFQ